MNRSNVVIHSLLILAISGATNASATWQEPTSPKEKARAITVEGVGIDVPLPIRFGEDQLVSSSRQRPFSELVRLDFDRKRRTGRTLVFLSNGDRLPVVVDKIQNEALFATYNGQTVSIPLEFAAAIAFDLPETNAARRERLRRFSSNREEDTVSLSNGDEVTGEIQSLSAETVRVEAATGLRTIPRKLVTGIQFSEELHGHFAF
ncbi:MAG: hypothetical protein AB8G99_17250 [Planctomycetaceae bacterium]